MGISRKDYSLLMHSIAESLADATNGEEFHDMLHKMIQVSYEVQTKKGRVVRHDVTDFIKTGMGALWDPMAAIGLDKLEFLTIYIGDNKVLETGSLGGKSGSDLAEIIAQVGQLPMETMRAFAKYTVLAMRNYSMEMYQGLVEHSSEVDMIDGFEGLIREFLEEELEETVTEFQQKLDAVFGVGDLLPAANWKPPMEGGEQNDVPPPPL